MNDLVPDLSAMRVHEVYIYHDRPLLFTCVNELDHKFLAVLVDETDNHDSWLYVPMSERRFEMVRSGGLDLQTAFGRPENGQAFHIQVSYNEQPLEIRTVLEADIPFEWLPKAGEILNLPTRTIKDSGQRRASQAYREVVTLALNFPGLIRTEAPAKKLGEILTTFQDALSAMIEGDAWMAVVGTKPGSFEVELEAAEQVDMFKYSSTGEALNLLVRLISLSDELDDLTEQLKHLGPNAAYELGKFYKAISSDVISTGIEWGSPRESYGGKALITAEQAIKAYDRIREKDEPEVKTIRVNGYLRGIDLDTRHFRFVDVDGHIYSGYVDRESIGDEAIQRAHIRNFYSASIQENYIPASADRDPKVLYDLLSLSHIAEFDSDEVAN